MTLDTLARAIAARLESSGIPRDEARLDAELLLRESLGWDRAAWLARALDPVPAPLPVQLEALVSRRVAREPMAYILGRCEFWALEFEVGPGVLVPRPETEFVVEHALARLAASAAAHVVDVGTGSGCLAVALAAARPQAHVTATDVSEGALVRAPPNAARHRVSHRITFRHGPLLAGVESADLVVSNPPYVPERDRAGLPPEVEGFEPGSALFAGDDGLDVIRALVAESVRRVRPGGWLIFEFGFGQADAVSGLLVDAGAWETVEVARDLQGIPRTAIARRRDRDVRG